MDYTAAMKQAIKLAVRGNGYVSPNPRVGAVIIKNDEIIAEGWHREYGAAHAEVEAINKAGLDSFEGCTLVVNLEPCSHQGKTPPCADLIIEKKFDRVVFGNIDPNPEVSGQGMAKLVAAGIDVVSGVLEEECKWINRFFNKYITTGLPYIILKAAQSLDGCVATRSGESKWISSEESRRRSHALRSEVDAVLIGKKTAAVDNPFLTVRSVDGRNPKKVVFDTDLTLPLTINTFKDADRNNVVVCCNPKALTTRKAETLRLAGIEIIPVEINEQGTLNIPSALFALSDLGISSVMVEGGSTLLSSFVSAQMVDELHLFIAPKIIGDGLNTFGSFHINYLNEALNLSLKAVSKSDSDIHVIAVNN